MSLNSAPLFAARNSRSGYQIEQSVRFDNSGAQYFDRSVSTTSGETQWTCSLWTKFAQSGNTRYLFWASSGTNYTTAEIGGGQINFTQYNGAVVGRLITSQVFRDFSAWYHLVFVFDSPNATATNRMRLYVNGSEITSFATDTHISQNHQSSWNQSGYNHRIGRISSSPTYFDGYMAEFHHVSGQVLDPTSFGEYDENGVWRPIAYDGSHGTNGFYLDFSNTSNLGEDQAGSNDWTANNFTTSGGGTDVMSDTPTKNWCTLNPIDSFNQTISDGNLVSSNANNVIDPGVRATIPMSSGKWYWEVTCGTFTSAATWMLGVMAVDEVITANFGSADAYLYYAANGQKYNNGSNTAYGSDYTTGDIIGIAYDADNGKIWFAKNNTWQNSGDPSAGTGEAFSGITKTVAAYAGTGLYQVQSTFNFGQREFAYPPGTYSATQYFNTVTYAGNGSTQSITGVGFQPDLVWIKARNQAENHYVADSIRGAYAFLNSNTTGSQNSTTNYDPMSSFDSDGFTVRNITTGGSTDNQTNDGGVNYVAWCWKAGGTSSSNTDGTITSTVSANQTAGFSIATYTGNGTGGTIGHGLGVAPTFIITKRRDATSVWNVFHGALGGTKVLYLNQNSSEQTDSSVWNNTSPSSTVFTVGTDTNINTNTGTYVAYCFAEVAGYSKFGSYTGNGSVDGPEVNDLGFAPALLAIKRTDSLSEWAVYDSARGNDNQLRWDQTDTDNTNSAVNVRLTSSGFKIATSDVAQNASGGTYIYMAWARNFSADVDFKELNTANLPAPDIADGSDYLNTVLYTGTGSNPRSVTGVGFQPSWLWIKRRSGTNLHHLVDEVRGASNALASDSVLDEFGSQIGSLDSDGFTTNSNAGQAVNASGSTYVAWSWLASNTSGSSNTDGTITSTVSANPTAGFSIATYQGTGANATVGHGLGVAPSMIIVKRRDNGVGDTNWFVYHSHLNNGVNPAGRHLHLNTTDSTDGLSSVWNDTAPTSSVFSVGTNVETNGSGGTFVAYCFVEVEGYSKFGSYTGNGSLDGPFVYCGFRPAFVMIKRDDSTGEWFMVDTSRNPYNPADDDLFANADTAETASSGKDLLSNGFKIRESGASMNASGGSFIFMAFAEHPFGGSSVSPATAR